MHFVPEAISGQKVLWAARAPSRRRSSHHFPERSLKYSHHFFRNDGRLPFLIKLSLSLSLSLAAATHL